MTMTTVKTSNPGPTGQRASGVTKKLLSNSSAARKQRSATIKLYLGIFLTTIVVLPIILAQVLPLADVNEQNRMNKLLPPLSEGHLFGTDQLGRDLLSRVIHGGQVSLLIGILAVVLSGLIGIVLGSLAGYFGGWVDSVISRLIEAQLSLPLLMMLLLVVALFGPSIPVITFVIAIAQWPEPARLTRSLVLVEREKPYVQSAKVLGLPQLSTLVRHIIPNVISQVIVVVLLLLATAVLMESALSFLGAGPQRPFATWGRIISDGRDFVTTAWWIVTLPGAVIAMLVVGVNLLGDGMRDRVRRQKADV